jgi:hypothetical protein
MRAIYGDLGRNVAVADAFAAALNQIWAGGTLAALQSYLGQG